MLQLVHKDIAEATYLILPSCAVAIVLTSIYIILYYRNNISWKLIARKAIPIFLVITYSGIICGLTPLNRAPGSRNGVDLLLFATFKNNKHSMSYVFENFILFIPFTIFLAFTSEKFRKGYWSVLVVAVFSAGIEVLQYITKRGYLQLDDFILNTLGAFLVAIVINVLRRIIQRLKN